jgi:Acyl-CoA dehydrogenase, C-terminal domain
MMDQAERDLVRASMAQLLAGTKPAELPAALVSSGWLEVLDDDPVFAASVLAEEQGRSLAVSPSLDLVMLHGAGLPVDADAAVVLPLVSRHPSPPGRSSPASVEVDGLVLAGHERAGRFLVATDNGVVAVGRDALDLQPIGGTDPDLGLQRVRTGRARPAAAETRPTPADVVGAVAAGRRFLAAELVGLTERMLADTVAYVLDRRQFGRQIGSFQTVKHRLADVRVATSAARAGVGTAYEDLEPCSAMAAKILAGRAHRLASTHCHQVHGGIAFTVEHGFHRFIRRGQVLDGILGSADDLTVALGRRLLADRRVPRTPPLREEVVPW